MKVSVVITTKDRLEFLSRAVDSVLDNSIPPDEIVIVNDGGSYIKKELFPTDVKTNIYVFNNKDSIGGNAARNLGVAKSSGDVIFFLDDDDALKNNSIETRLKCFENDAIGLVYTGKVFVKSSNLDKEYRKSLPVEHGDMHKTLLRNGNLIGSTSCVAMRRIIFDSAGKFDEDLRALQDYDLWIRASAITSVANDNGANLVYTIHDNGDQISNDYSKYLDAGLYLYDKYERELKELNLSNKFIASRYLRVSIAASKSSYFLSLKYAAMSLSRQLSFKAFFMLIPRSITRFFRSVH
tara:strand:- start:808 stop:1692 length:885 start_codon:yes stop_codon:yes gene_type:complete